MSVSPAFQITLPCKIHRITRSVKNPALICYIAYPQYIANMQRHCCHNVTGWCTAVPVCREAADFPTENGLILAAMKMLMSSILQWLQNLTVEIEMQSYLSTLSDLSVFSSHAQLILEESYDGCVSVLVLASVYCTIFSQFLDIVRALSVTLSLFVSTCKMLPHKRLTSGGDIFYANLELKVRLHHAGCCSASVMYQSV